MKRFFKKMMKGGSNDKDADKAESSDKAPKTKEAEKVLVPKFPQPESYRNWRIRVRDAVVAASDKPDKAFEWLSRVWEADMKEETLRDPEGFTTLDAKILSALSNILEGDFARQVDTFKETEANAGRPVRGRQILFRIHNYFATNAQHGAVYDMEDLLSVTLLNENLLTFMRNWDTVLSGIPKTPEASFLEPLFHRQVKKVKALSHDINIYERALEGSKERSYSFLYDAANAHLNRKRLERNRERMARQTGSPAVPTAPAPKRVPKGFCISWVRNGSCTKGDQCKYKHQTPAKGRGRSATPAGSRASSASPGGKPKICKFYKQGRCDRGGNCNFLHTGKPGAAAPSETSGKGSKC